MDTYYLIEVSNFEYGAHKSEYRMKASSWPAAVAKAARAFKKEKFTRHRLSQWHIKVTKV